MGGVHAARDEPAVVQHTHKTTSSGGLLNNYRALNPLGEGGFGTVVEAERTSTGERVALKELAHLGPEALVRFKHEFRALQGLHHPNLVRLEELFEQDGRWFIAMELVEGCDWLQWVRSPDASANDNAPAVDQRRLEETLGDIARGLQALHEAGFVHCDLKPANIRVDRQGRAVLLDFGLLTQTDAEAQSTKGMGSGTVAYMAPEQAAGATVGPAADWYALGTSLYEALTGRLPFTGSRALEIMLAKQGKLPHPPSSACDRPVPGHLEALTMGLLAPDPDERADGRDVLGTVHESPPQLPPAQTHLAPKSPGVDFAGRRGELKTLEASLDRVRAGEGRQVFVEGESGIGKSALVEEFLRQVGLKHPEIVILRGRCFENESVPFKGMDGVMDSLARHLKRLPVADCGALLPRWAKVLQELFPVMGGVKPLADKRLRDIPAEPFARRRAAVATLADLFGAMCDGRPTVVVVDDIQWADPESFPLFEALAATSGLLLLATVRQRQEIPGPIQPLIDTLLAHESADVLHVRGLRRSEAREFAAQLLGLSAPPAWVTRIVDEAHGHPLFVAEIARHAQHEKLEGDLRDLTLDQVLAARIARLDDDLRLVLELIACAQSPKAVAQLKAAALETNAPDVLAALKAQHLIRSGSRGLVQCYHDKVRAVALSGLKEPRYRELHRRWAQALCTGDEPDPAEVGRHFDMASMAQQALPWLESGAERALSNLGFAQAESLYRRCVELGGETADNDARRRWWVGAGHACARGGRSTQAAAFYRQAASLSDHGERVQLRVSAAQHLLQSAQVEEGLTAAREALRDVGIGMPATEGAGLRAVLWSRLKLKLRGLSFTPADDELPEQDRLALDALEALTAPVSCVQLFVGAALSCQHLTRALQTGDRSHTARALASEAYMQIMQQPERYGTEQARFDQATELARESNNPATVAVVALRRGSAAQFAGDTELAEALVEEAMTRMVRDCPGEPWILTTVRMTQASYWAVTGAHAKLADTVSTWIAEAQERGDRFAQTALSTMGAGYLRWLRQDEPHRGLLELERVMEYWPKEPFSQAQLLELITGVALRTYGGGSTAWTWVDPKREQLDRVPVLKGGLTRDIWMGVLAGSALAHLASPTGRGDARAHRALKRACTVLARANGFYGVAGKVIVAQRHALQGEREQALALARDARGRLASIRHFSQHGAAYLEGLLLAGGEGKALREGALSAFSEQGYVNPRAALQMYLPSLDGLQELFG